MNNEDVPQKEYHLYLYDFLPPDMIIIVDCVENAILNGAPVIKTVQVVTCETRLFICGYRIFVHPTPGDVFEIKLGDNERTSREIKMGHCLYLMILSGEFSIKRSES